MSDPRALAQEVFQQAYRLQMRGELQAALDLYTRSIEIFPTAEAFTFRGWTYSFLGDYRQAIEECKQAIALDPELGNPYNDIGAYLIEQGRLEEAIPWLEKAATAPRYANPCFPLFNLGRVYERKHNLHKAQELYLRALANNNAYMPALRALKRVRAQWN